MPDNSNWRMGYINAAQVHLWALLPETPRQSTRDRVLHDAKRLAKEAHKYLSMATEYNVRQAFRNAYAKPSPSNVYPAWCKATTQSKPLPFESGDNTLPGMERFHPNYVEPEQVKERHNIIRSMIEKEAA